MITRTACPSFCFTAIVLVLLLKPSVFGFVITSRGFTTQQSHPANNHHLVHFDHRTQYGQRHQHQRYATQLFAEKLPDISKMRASELKKELESYGISTKSLFEKKEFEDALKKARAEGKTPKSQGNNDKSDPVNGETASTPNGSSGSNGDTDTDTGSSSSREERYQKAFEDAKKMKVGELKKELTDRGISTKSFFEKSEFIKAYAEVIADNKANKSSSSSSSAGQGFGSGRQQQQRRRQQEEPRDPSYRDVVMQKFDRRQIIGSNVIDVRAR